MISIEDYYGVKKGKKWWALIDRVDVVVFFCQMRLISFFQVKVWHDPSVSSSHKNIENLAQEYLQNDQNIPHHH